MVEIKNVEIFGLERSMRKAAYSMKMGDPDLTDVGNAEDIKRSSKLGKVKIGSGHDTFLKGIIVQGDIYDPHYFLPQLQRYHWFEIVTSQSKMHRLGRANLANQCDPHTDPRIIAIVEELQQQFRDDKHSYENRMKLLASTPLGFSMWAAFTTNYLQLKTMYHQRRRHKLKDDWGSFCDWCESLPMFEQMILGKSPDGERI